MTTIRRKSKEEREKKFVESAQVLKSNSEGQEKEKNQFNKPDKKRNQQTRKVVILNDDLNQAWIKFEATQKLDGLKISFQSFVEKLLRKSLIDYLD